MIPVYHLEHVQATSDDLLKPGAPYPPLRDPQSQLKALGLYQEGFKRRTDDLARRVRRGDLTAAQWEMAMRDEIRDLHVAATVIARGGDRASVTFSQWGRVGAQCKKQYKFLHGFAQTLERSAMNALTGMGDLLSEAYMSWRSNLYAGAGKASYYQGMAMGMLPQVPGDGQTRCGGNCNCVLRFEEGEYPWIVHVYWELRPGESCEDCVALAASWAPYVLELPIGLDASEVVQWLSFEAEGFPAGIREPLALRT